MVDDIIARNIKNICFTYCSRLTNSLIEKIAKKARFISCNICYFLVLVNLFSIFFKRKIQADIIYRYKRLPLSQVIQQNFFIFSYYLVDGPN